jgi:signal transduction histidine kinase
LRHIDGYARILKAECTEELSEGARRYLGQILEAVTHMGHLVDDLLNLAQLGRRDMIRERTNLRCGGSSGNRGPAP